MAILKSKNKRISKKNVIKQRCLILTLAVISSFAIGSRALAAESPLQSLVDFTQEKISDLNKVVPVSPPVEDQQKPQQTSGALGQNKINQQEQLNVPQPVSDPKEIEKAVEFASEKTGVRKDFLMGMLVVESNLGRNPGKCTYKEVEVGAEKAHANGQLSSQAWQTFQNRRDTMKGIANGLGYDYEQLKVSCNPSTYAGTGGAMGIPQFMPDVWLSYKDRIASIVGKSNPDPWNIQDGVVAMALLVGDTPGVTDHNLFSERNAAKMYLSGTTSVKYDWYANQILYWASNYKDLLV